MEGLGSEQGVNSTREKSDRTIFRFYRNIENAAIHDEGVWMKF